MTIEDAARALGMSTEEAGAHALSILRKLAGNQLGYIDPEMGVVDVPSTSLTPDESTLLVHIVGDEDR